MMLPIHLAIGVVEGVITAGVINYVRIAKPDIIAGVAASMPLASGVSVRKVVISFLIIAVLTGGLLSWFASRNPDGLEWSLEKTYGKPELPAQEHGIAPALKKVQEKTAFLPDYNFRKKEENKGAEESGESKTSWPQADAGTSASGLIGAGIVLSIILSIAMAFKFIRRKKA